MGWGWGANMTNPKTATPQGSFSNLVPFFSGWSTHRIAKAARICPWATQTISFGAVAWCAILVSPGYSADLPAITDLISLMSSSRRSETCCGVLIEFREYGKRKISHWIMFTVCQLQNKMGGWDRWYWRTPLQDSCLSKYSSFDHYVGLSASGACGLLRLSGLHSHRNPIPGLMGLHE